MKVKAVLFFIILILVLAPLCAKSFSNTLSYDFTLPETSHILTDNVSWSFNITGDFYLGPYAGLGFSLRHFTTYGSNALVYGPALKLGAEAQYRLNRNIFLLRSGANVTYSQFPTVLYGNLDAGYIFKLNDHWGLSLEAGLLFGKDYLSFETGAKVRYFL